MDACSLSSSVVYEITQFAINGARTYDSTTERIVISNLKTDRRNPLRNPINIPVGLQVLQYIPYLNSTLCSYCASPDVAAFAGVATGVSDFVFVLLFPLCEPSDNAFFNLITCVSFSYTTTYSRRFPLGTTLRIRLFNSPSNLTEPFFRK